MGFTFKNTHSKDLYIKGIRTNPVVVPEKKHNFVEIPGKPGSVLVRDSSPKDVDETVQCWYERPSNVSARQYGRMLNTWFTASNWNRLIFDDDPNYYREAVVTSSIDLEDIRLPSGQFTITFRCRPSFIEVVNTNNVGGDGI